jgi:cysteinyl-tRNA synthetase
MKTNQLLTAIKELFDESEKKQQGKKKHLKQVLQQLKAKQKVLGKMLKGANDKKECKGINKEIDVIIAQRRKGLKLLKSMKKD